MTLFNYAILIYGSYLSIILVVGIAYYRPEWFSAAKVYCMSVIINSTSNTVTVIPDRNTRIMSNWNVAEYKLEFELPHAKIKEIIDLFGQDITNNVISGVNSDYIMNSYIIPHLVSNNMTELISEISTHFSC
jgi:hypothetical protein